MSDKQLTSAERDAIRRKLWSHRTELQPRTLGRIERVKMWGVKRLIKLTQWARTKGQR